MESDKNVDDRKVDLFVRYSEEINKAYVRAVREALLRHKRAGNPVAVERDGKLVILQPNDILTDDDT
jgi:hypothetical protein